MRTKFALQLMCLLSISAYVHAQTSPLVANSYVSINKMVDSRINFNKTLIKSRTIQIANLPKSKYIFNQQGSHTINIEGLNFIIENKNIVCIEEIVLSKAALNIINDHLMVLDKMQFAYSESANQEYLAGEKNRYLAFNNDRQFYSVLKSLKTTINEINKLAKADHTSNTAELSLAKWKQPKIDWQFFSEVANKDINSQLGK